MSETAQTTEVKQDDTEPQGIARFYYTVGDYNILLETGIKTEIIEKHDIFPIPHTPDWCQGMISLRGKLIPVANLHKLLTTAEVGNKSHWLLVLEMAPFPQLAVAIDQLPMQQRLNNEMSQDVQPEHAHRWLQSYITSGDKTLYEANHTELFEQLIQENETNRTDFQDTPNRDLSGNNA